MSPDWLQWMPYACTFFSLSHWFILLAPTQAQLTPCFFKISVAIQKWVILFITCVSPAMGGPVWQRLWLSLISVRRLCGEKERRRLGRAGGRLGVDRGLCGEQPNGASWFYLRSRFHFCFITSLWPTSQDKFFSTTFYLEEPFCIFIKIFQGLILECPDVAINC